MVTIRPVLIRDADLLFPLIYKTAVTDTLFYDGPGSLEDFRQKIGAFAAETAAGTRHQFTVFVGSQAAGNVGVRPYKDGFRADIGIWIGLPFQGRGAGTMAVRLISEYGFEQLGLEKLEAFVYVGNHTSRRVFEKNGFRVEGTIRRGVRKRGVFRDEWILGILREEWAAAGVNTKAALGYGAGK